MKKIVFYCIVMSLLIIGCGKRPKAPEFSSLIYSLRRSQVYTPKIEYALWQRIGRDLELYGYQKLYFDSLSFNEKKYTFAPAVRMLYGYNLKYVHANDECVPTSDAYFGFYYVGMGDMGGRPDTLYIMMSDSIIYDSYIKQAVKLGFDNSSKYYSKNHYIYRFPDWNFPRDWYTSFLMDCVYGKKCKYVLSIVGC